MNAPIHNCTDKTAAREMEWEPVLWIKDREDQLLDVRQPLELGEILEHTLFLSSTADRFALVLPFIRES